jgi:hypothetical protein
MSSDPPRSLVRWIETLAFVLAATLTLSGLPYVSNAQVAKKVSVASLEGAWRGGGRADQTATVRQVGNNRYSGSFYNSEYSISGVIEIVVHGSSQIVRLTGDGASGVLNLSR